MKKSAVMAAAVAAVCATGAHAGSLADPEITAPVIVEEATSSSSGSALVGLLAVILSIPVLSD